MSTGNPTLDATLDEEMGLLKRKGELFREWGAIGDKHGGVLVSPRDDFDIRRLGQIDAELLEISNREMELLKQAKRLSGIP